MSIEPSSLEFFLGGWTDVTTYVSYQQGMLVTRGLQNETTKPATPGRARFTLRNETGIWDPREPTGAYYGQWGKGVPVRWSLSRVRDSFTRTVSSGWGSTDTGQAWTTAGGTASDYSTNGTTGRIVMSAAGDRLVYLTPAQLSQYAQDVAVTWSMSASSVTGAVILPCQLMLRVTDTSNYMAIRCTVDTSQAITMTLLSVVAGTETSIVSEVTGYTYTAGSSWRMRGLVEGQSYRAKIWPANQLEPYDWSWSSTLTTATGVSRSIYNDNRAGAGIRVSIAGGNTNTPVTFTYDNFEVRSPRFFGQITSLTHKSDQTGKIRTVDVEASDIFNRLQTGASPLDSTLKHGYLQLATNQPVSYWPLEDGTTATQGAPALGEGPMEVTQGSIKFGAYDWGYGSDKIATPNNGTLHGYIPEYPDNDGQFRTLIALPSSGLSDGQALWTVHTTGNLGRWRLTWHTGGSLKLTWFASDGVTLVGDSGLLTFGATNVKWFMQFNLTQSGGDINWTIATLVPGQSVGAVISSTVTGKFFGQISDIYLTPDMDISSVSFGHVSVQPTTDNLFAMSDPLAAWTGEFAALRTSRIMHEANLAVSTWRAPNPDGEPWPKMGPQSIATITDTVEDAILADRAALVACRGSDLVLHRTGHALQWADPRATISVSGGQLGAPPIPADDNARLANDVTIKQGDGNSARETKETGRNSAASPTAGGIGRVTVSDTRNLTNVEDLADYAAWRLAEGTFDGPRYPQVTVMRHASEVTSDATLFAALLDVEIGDGLYLAGLRYGDDRAHVLGYTERYDTITHTFTWNCAPGNLWHQGKTDALRAGAAASTLASSVTSTATSLSLATSDGPVWIDSAGYPSMFPFTAVVGGEVVTVTAISGTSSPQTATVTRSVNGVVKAQSAGTAVTLADPYRAGFGPRY
jgi:hypothetical protein